MTSLTWDTYRQWLGPELVGPLPTGNPPSIQDFSTDTRTIAPGHWFLPISGANFDGHKFIEEALSKGAAGFFYEPHKKISVSTERGIPVKNVLTSFQKIASGWRSTLPNLTMVALTGSSGKTTTKEMVQNILKLAHPTFATPGSFNNEIGVPKTLLSITPSHRFAVLEFGARMPGNIKFLCDMANPDIVALLNVGSAHLGVFGSIENLLNTKAEIFRDSKRDAIQIAFADDERIVKAAKSTGKKTIFFGTSKMADIRILSSDFSPTKTVVTLSLLGQSITLNLSTAHELFPINAAAASAMATAAGVGAEFIVSGLTSFSGVKGRFQVHDISGATVIDDTYNANPASLKAGLASVIRMYPSRDKLLILGDMLELGDDAAHEHRIIGEKILADLKGTELVTIGTLAKNYADGAINNGFPPANVKSFANVDDFLALKNDLVESGRVIYAKGSNSIKLSKIIESLMTKV